MRALLWAVRSAAGRFIFGHDIFISYARADGTTYAADLAAKLTEDRFFAKLDQWGTPPGEEVPDEIIDAVRRSSVLVVLGTEGAVASDGMRCEIEAFLPTRRYIVPVDVDGHLEKATWWPRLRGLPVTREIVPEQGAGNPKETGNVSPAVVRRIERLFEYTKKDRRLRIASTAMLALVAVLVVAAILAGRSAMRNGAAARVAEANAARTIAAAGFQTRQATSNLRRVQAEAATATTNAMREAARQAEISGALRTAGEASVILRTQPRENVDAAALAVSSVRRLNRIGIHSAAVAGVLRDAASLIPRIERRFRFKPGQARPALTRDGRFLAYEDAAGSIVRIDLARGETRKLASVSRGEYLEGLTISDSGSRVAAFCRRERGRGGAIRVWPTAIDVPTSIAPEAIALSYDGILLAVVGRDGNGAFEIFDSLSGELLASHHAEKREADGPPLFARHRIFAPTPGGAVQIAFNRDDQALSVSSNSGAGVWGWKTGEMFAAPNGVEGIFFSPTDAGTAGVLGERSVGVWEWRRWNEADAKPIWSAQAARPSFIALEPSGQFIWVIDNGRAKIGQLGKELGLEDLPDWPDVYRLAVADENLVIIVGQDRTVRVFDRLTEVARRAVPDMPEIGVSANGTVAWCEEGEVELWRPAPSFRNVVFPLVANAAKLVALSSAVPMVASGECGSLSVAAGDKSKITHVLPDCMTAVALSDDGALFAGFKDGSFCMVRKPIERAARYSRRKHGAAVRAIAVSRTGRFVAVAGGGRVTIWSTADGLAFRYAISHPGRVERVVFGAHDEHLATASDGEVRFWDLGAGAATLRRSYKVKTAASLAFGGNDRTLAAASRMVTLWDVASTSTAPLASFDARADVTSMAFDPSGNFIATASQRLAVDVWAWHQQPPAAAEFPTETAMEAVGFSKDGTKLLAANVWGFTFEFDWRDDAVAAALCRRIADFDRAAYLRGCR